ncbi:PH domain-containing protein [Microbacterium sp.]|uniref:PH domain-containing protein n=1 Tax=Microbacterium sp. TaxID=51671 RepID=UPI003A876703
MSQPSAYSDRPVTPAPGATAEELRVARFRPSARHLVWSAIVLVAVAGAIGYYAGNPPAPIPSWVLWLAAALIVVLLVLVPWARWFAHTYTITTRRIIAQSGLFVRGRRDLTHVRGYTISERRGPLQRAVGAGTLTLDNGVDAPLRLVDVPNVRLVHEALADQVEVSQILAHRDSHSIPVVDGG